MAVSFEQDVLLHILMTELLGLKTAAITLRTAEIGCIFGLLALRYFALELLELGLFASLKYACEAADQQKS